MLDYVHIINFCIIIIISIIITIDLSINQCTIIQIE